MDCFFDLFVDCWRVNMCCCIRTKAYYTRTVLQAYLSQCALCRPFDNALQSQPNLIKVSSSVVRVVTISITFQFHHLPTTQHNQPPRDQPGRRHRVALLLTSFLGENLPLHPACWLDTIGKTTPVLFTPGPEARKQLEKPLKGIYN